LSRTKPDTTVLKRAATWSYIVGAWYFIGVVVLYVMLFLTMAPLMSILAMGTPYSPSMTELSQLLNAILLPIAIVAVITIPIMIFFGYNEYKVGEVYNMGSLKLAGVSAIIVSIAIVPVVYGFYALVEYLTNPSTYGILSSIALLGIGALVAGIFLLVSLIAFMVGLSGMRHATGISDFNTAMWLTIAGLLFTFLIAVGIILFGSGLRKLAKQGAERGTGAIAAEEGAKVSARRQATYCPYCGAKVEADALFCPTCGSSLKKEA
jgi:hypothetical protein